MPNRYSHAFVLSDYQRRGVIDSIYQKDIDRYHQNIDDLHSASSSFSHPSSSPPAVYPTSSLLSIPEPSTPRASPARPVPTVVAQTCQLGQGSSPHPESRPSTASPSSHTPSSVVTQIYKPQSPRSYFDSNSSQASQATAPRSLSPTTELYTPLSPLPTTLEYLDFDSSPGSERTTPRTSLEDLSLSEMLLEAIPSSAVGGTKHHSYEVPSHSDGEADDAVPPPISRRKRETSSSKSSAPASNHSRPPAPVSRPTSRQYVSFNAQAWSPPASATTGSAPTASAGLSAPTAHTTGPSRQNPPAASRTTPHAPPTSQSQIQTNKLQKANNNRPALQRTRTELNAEEMQLWKKEVQQAKWRRGRWVGALVGMSFAGRKSRD
ncbi:hypothetical protein MMC16_003886 [Acarospora aff. strigata]|nr:hypothetical protein [Acarospora aff. strigata]